MLQTLIRTLAGVPWNHFLDIALMSTLVYQAYLRFRGTRALRVLIGLFALGIAFFAARATGLVLTSWLLGFSWVATLIFFLIIFQSDIRQILQRFNPLLSIRGILRQARRIRIPEESVEIIAETAFSLASKLRGALIVFERRNPLFSLFSSLGERIDARLSKGLVETILESGTPLHDGALFIREERIERAGCVLPLSENPEIALHYGTRHRAALGITEQSDSVALVVSEERGEVSAVEQGKIRVLDTPEQLSTWLAERLHAGEASERPRGVPVKSLFTRNWRQKLASVAIVGALWLVTVGPDAPPVMFDLRLEIPTEAKLTVPVEYRNIPVGLRIDENRIYRIDVFVTSKKEFLNTLDTNQIPAVVDLQKAHAGANRLPLGEKNIQLPPFVRFVGFFPKELDVRLHESAGESAQVKP